MSVYSVLCLGLWISFMCFAAVHCHAAERPKDVCTTFALALMRDYVPVSKGNNNLV